MLLLLLLLTTSVVGKLALEGDAGTAWIDGARLENGEAKGSATEAEEKLCDAPAALGAERPEAPEVLDLDEPEVAGRSFSIGVVVVGVVEGGLRSREPRKQGAAGSKAAAAWKVQKLGCERRRALYVSIYTSLLLIHRLSICASSCDPILRKEICPRHS